MRSTLNDKLGARIVPILLIILFTVSLLHIGNWQSWFIIDPNVLMIFRYVLLTIFCLYAYLKNSLTTWIFISMLIGAEIGIDFPEVAVHLKVISKVFLKLIKTIIAILQ